MDIKSINKKLVSIQKYVENYNANPKNTLSKIGSITLDKECIGISERINNKTSFLSINDNIIFIVSKISSIGGHTRQLFEFINSVNNKNIYIISTEINGRSDTSGMRRQFNDNKVSFITAPRCSHYEKFIWLNEKIKKVKPKHIVLFVDGADSISISATSCIKSCCVHFYHHMDIYLSLGIYIKNYLHIDHYPNGYYNCRNTLNIKNFYIPLSVTETSKKGYNHEIKKKIHKTCTVGQYNKINVPIGHSYASVISTLIIKHKITHMHIGYLLPHTILHIRLLLFLSGVSQNKFKYIKRCELLKTTIIKEQIDIYIASFPIGGALTQIEMQSLGIPILIHNNLDLSHINCIDSCYTGVKTWLNENDLVNIIKNYTETIRTKDSKKAYKYFLETHSKNFFNEYLSSPENYARKPKNKYHYMITHKDLQNWQTNMKSISAYVIYLLNKVKIILRNYV